MKITELKKALDELGWSLKDIAFVTRKPLKEVELNLARGIVADEVYECIVNEYKSRGLSYRHLMSSSARARAKP